MSASEQPQTVYECIRGGAEEYLVKPVTKKEVQNIWTHVLRRGGIGKVAAQVGQGLGGLQVCGQGGYYTGGTGAGVAGGLGF